jgi:hypothetical protein
MTWGQTLSPLGAPAFQHQSSILAGHPRSETVRLGSSPIVRLKGPLRHSGKNLLLTKTPRLIGALSYVKKARLVVVS